MATEHDALLSEAYADELSDCPWCGSQPEIEIEQWQPGTIRARIACGHCGVCGPHSEWVHSEPDAVSHAAAQWNAGVDLSADLADADTDGEG